jgi:uncharacterized membrane protein YkvI
MKNVFRQISVILGCVLGAGFVGGKELLVIFRGASVFSPLLFAVVFAGIVYILQRFAADNTIADADCFCRALLPNHTTIVNIFLLLSYFVVVVTMLAGANVCLNQLFGLTGKVPIFSFLTAILAWLVMRKGTGGLELFSKIAVPVILVYLLVVYCFFGGEMRINTTPTLLPPVNYAMFNAVMAVGVVCSFSRGSTKRETLVSTVIVGVVLFVFTLLQLAVLCGNSGSDVPLLMLTKKSPALFIAGAVVVMLAILTSLLSNALPIVQYVEGFVGDFSIATSVVFFVALLLSQLGLTFIIKYFYPAVSVLGVGMMGVVIWRRRIEIAARRPQ